MDHLTNPSDESSILARVIEPRRATLTRPAAEALVALDFDASDVERMNSLAERNRLGQATEAEIDELESYSRVGNLLNLLQSKARRSLADG